MAMSLGANAVVVTRVHCTTKLFASYFLTNSGIKLYKRTILETGYMFGIIKYGTVFVLKQHPMLCMFKQSVTYVTEHTHTHTHTHTHCGPASEQKVRFCASKTGFSSQIVFPLTIPRRPLTPSIPSLLLLFCVCASVVSYVTIILSSSIPHVSLFCCFWEAVLCNCGFSWIQRTLVTTTAFVPKDIAIKMNLLLLRILTEQNYSRTSLSRTRLFRITAYLEVKIWSLF